MTDINEDTIHEILTYIDDDNYVDIRFWFESSVLHRNKLK